MDVNAHALAVDIINLKIQGFMQSEAACVNGGQICFVLRSVNRIKDCPDLFQAQHSGQSLFAFGMDEFKGVPVALEHIDKKEFYSAIANPQGSGGPFINVFAVQEVVL